MVYSPNGSTRGKGVRRSEMFCIAGKGLLVLSAFLPGEYGPNVASSPTTARLPPCASALVLSAVP